MDRLRSCLLLVALLIAGPGCGGGGGYGNPGNGNPANTSPPLPSPSGGVPDVVVTIVGQNDAMSFSPDPVVINAGQRIAWRNGDTIVHTATGTGQGGFDTSEIAAGASSNAILFGTAGGFPYRCNVHPAMVGTVTVR